MSTNINRRTFIAGSALTGAGLALVGSSLRAAESPSNKVVVGVMGLSRGSALATGFAKQPGVEVKYVCDVDSTRAASCAKAVGQASGKDAQPVRDFREVLDDKAVDILVCAAPNHWHGPATILACAAGKNVYVEKPCSHNPREGELMIEAARKHNRAVQMGNQRRSGSGTIEAIQKLHDGVIGRVYLSRSWYNNARGSIGRGKPAAVPSYLDYELWQGPAPRKPYLDNVVHYNWHWRWHWGNGELGNNGIHSIDLCRWGLGVDYPIRVSSSGGRYHFEDDQETPDTQTVCYEFAGRQQIVWEGKSCNRHGGGFVVFYGDGGTMELDENGTHRIYDGGGKLISEVKANTRGDSEHIANLIDAIRNDDPKRLNSEIEEGHKSTLLCHLGNIAQRTGGAINCNAKTGHPDNADAADLWTREYEKGWEPKV